MLTYYSTVLALQGGAGAPHGFTGTGFVGCCFASTAIESWARAVSAGRCSAACEGRAWTDTLTGYCTLQCEEKGIVTAQKAAPHCVDIQKHQGELKQNIHFLSENFKKWKLYLDRKP